MKFTKTVQVPATTREVVDKIVCDMCGEVIEECFGEIDKVYVKHTTGYSYPDGGNLTKTMFDICPTCFTSKVRPWLEAQGAKPRDEEVDW